MRWLRIHPGDGDAPATHRRRIPHRLSSCHTGRGPPPLRDAVAECSDQMASRMGGVPCPDGLLMAGLTIMSTYTVRHAIKGMRERAVRVLASAGPSLGIGPSPAPGMSGESGVSPWPAQIRASAAAHWSQVRSTEIRANTCRSLPSRYTVFFNSIPMSCSIRRVSLPAHTAPPHIVPYHCPSTRGSIKRTVRIDPFHIQRLVLRSASPAIGTMRTVQSHAAGRRNNPRCQAWEEFRHVNGCRLDGSAAGNISISDDTVAHESTHGRARPAIVHSLMLPSSELQGRPARRSRVHQCAQHDLHMGIGISRMRLISLKAEPSEDFSVLADEILHWA